MNPGTLKYFASAGADNIVSIVPSLLIGIIIGADVASAVIEVSDSKTDGDGDVKVYLAGSTLMTSCSGYVPVNAVFSKGISADLTNQTNVTFVYQPLG